MTQINISELSIRDKIKIHKKTKSIDIYNEIDDNFFKEDKRCKICNRSIVYYNSYFSINKNGELIKSNKSSKTTKIINGKEYTLSVCEKCLENKFNEEYTKRNPSRIFNMLNDITKYAFNIDDEDYNKELNSGFRFGSGLRKGFFIKKYGEKDGILKWNSYRKKQSYTNSLDYFKKKGYTEEEYNLYNKSRAVTEKNLIKKYGKEKGLKKWDEYKKRQSYTNTLEYYKEKYGDIKGKSFYNNLNKSKAVNLNHFIKKYGKILGTKKYFELLEKRKINYSKKSQVFFDEIDKLLLERKNFKTYYATKNKEFSKLLSNNSYIFLDYFIYDLNIAIEFNGDCFHGNPDIYKDDDKPNPFNKNITAKELRDNDIKRYELLKKDFGINTIVVWENDVYRKIKPIDIVNNILNLA